MTMLVKLENYYRECGILSTDFRCEHECCCREGLPLTPETATLEEIYGTFTQAKAAFVGDLYGETSPRLLFVSLDPGGALKPGDPEYNHISPHSRTLAGVWEGNARIMRRYVNDTETIPRPRLQGTNRVAEAILREFPGILQGGHAMRFYAHINAAKCTVNKKGRKQAGKTLFEKCRGYLRGEIDTLCPDIIVTHGGKARRAVSMSFRHRGKISKSHPYIWTIESEDGRMFWLHTYHPTARYEKGKTKRPFEIQMDGEDGGPGLDGYAKLIRDFISNRDS